MLPILNLSTIEYDDKNSFLLLNLKGDMTLEAYKNYFLEVLEKAKKYNCRHWIYDLSSFEYNSLQARIWQIAIFLPKCFKEFNQEMIVGIIPPPNVLHKISIETAIKAVNKMNYSYQLRYFSDREKAIQWILSKK